MQGLGYRIDWDASGGASGSDAPTYADTLLPGQVGKPNSNLLSPIFNERQLDSAEFFGIAQDLLNADLTWDERAIVQEVIQQEFDRRVDVMALYYGMDTGWGRKVLAATMVCEYGLYPAGGKAAADGALSDLEVSWVYSNVYQTGGLSDVEWRTIQSWQRQGKFANRAWRNSIWRERNIPLPVEVRIRPSALGARVGSGSAYDPFASGDYSTDWGRAPAGSGQPTSGQQRFVPGYQTPIGDVMTSDVTRGLVIVGVGIAAIFIFKDMFK